MKSIRQIAAFLLVGLFPAVPAHAYTECTTTITRIHSGDSGNIYLLFANGGAGAVPLTDPDREATLSMAMTALVAGRSVTARYEADNVDCSATGLLNMMGFWLN